MSETPIKCWLIERGQAVGHEPTLWWSKSRYPDSETGRWTRVAGDAMRFPTEEAARRYADIYAGPHCTVTEHIFIDREVVPVDVIGLVVDEFLRWPLPDSVCCDPCACTPGYPNRSGTNLLTAQQARQMFEYLLEKLPRAESRFERAATDACARRAEALERALAAERERADRNEKDAERYRFGRNDGVVVQISVLRDDTRWVRCGDDLDAAIDAAMREGK